jgi:hypothetical protein
MCQETTLVTLGHACPRDSTLCLGIVIGELSRHNKKNYIFPHNWNVPRAALGGAGCNAYGDDLPIRPSPPRSTSGCDSNRVSAVEVALSEDRVAAYEDMMAALAGLPTQPGETQAQSMASDFGALDADQLSLADLTVLPKSLRILAVEKQKGSS